MKQFMLKTTACVGNYDSTDELLSHSPHSVLSMNSIAEIPKNHCQNTNYTLLLYSSLRHPALQAVSNPTMHGIFSVRYSPTFIKWLLSSDFRRGDEANQRGDRLEWQI